MLGNSNEELLGGSGWLTGRSCNGLPRRCKVLLIMSRKAAARNAGPFPRRKRMNIGEFAGRCFIRTWSCECEEGMTWGCRVWFAVQFSLFWTMASRDVIPGGEFHLPILRWSPCPWALAQYSGSLTWSSCWQEDAQKFIVLHPTASPLTAALNPH